MTREPASNRSTKVLSCKRTEPGGPGATWEQEQEPEQEQEYEYEYDTTSTGNGDFDKIRCSICRGKDGNRSSAVHH